MRYYDAGASPGDHWPWSCHRCGRTIYHDVTLCRECARPSTDDSARRTGAVKLLGVSVTLLDLLAKVLAFLLVLLL